MSFQRMVAIPQEEYAQLTAVQNVSQPLTQQMYKLESDYNTKEMISDPYKRLMLQAETLEGMKDLKEKMRNNINRYTPKLFHNRALSLFHSIEPFVKINDRAEIMDKDGQVVRDSRLEDLIQHAVTVRRRNMTPTGWQDFLQMLSENNVPKSMLNKDTLDELSKPMQKREPRPRKRKKVIARSLSNRLQHTSPQRTRLRKRSSSKGGRTLRESKRYPSPDFLKKF